jgi:hypothetical protein
MIDPCAFDNEGLVRDLPFQLRFYPNFNYRQVTCTLYEHREVHGEVPPHKRVLIDRVKNSIAQEGMRNPLIIEWYPQDSPRWLCTIGNNRYVALDELGVEGCEALVLYPLREITPPLSGHYEVLPFMTALARFDATYPWWNSETMRKFCPPLVPRCV